MLFFLLRLLFPLFFSSILTFVLPIIQPIIQDQNKFHSLSDHSWVIPLPISGLTYRNKLAKQSHGKH